MSQLQECAALKNVVDRTARRDSSTTNHGYGDEDRDNEDYFPFTATAETQSPAMMMMIEQDDDDEEGDARDGETRCWVVLPKDYGYGNELLPPSQVSRCVLPARPRRLPQ
jgi:hypothetical protein